MTSVVFNKCLVLVTVLSIGMLECNKDICTNKFLSSLSKCNYCSDCIKHEKVTNYLLAFDILGT